MNIQKLLNVSLQIKILGLIIFLLLLVIGLLTFMVGYMETKEDVKQAEKIALQTAKTLSYMQTTQTLMQHPSTLKEGNPIIEQMRDQVDASAIWIENREGELKGYAGDIKINRLTTNRDSRRSLLFGSYYVIHTRVQGDQQVLKGIAPVVIDYGAHGKVEGTVTVVFNMENIYENIATDIKKMVAVSGMVLLVGIAGSFFLARSIRKDTLGLEPFEIAALYRERNAILQSVKEGILSIDDEGVITTMNISARELLEIPVQVEGQLVTDVITASRMLELLQAQKGAINEELHHKDKMIIVNTQPIMEEGKQVGTVASFRDKTEIKKMIDALSEVRQYSEDLRAQAHEFTNKLYVILGTIQLGRYTEASMLIQEEAHFHEHHTEVLFRSVLDTKVQAILLGKLAKASEKKVNLVIDEESSMMSLPEHIGFSPLIVILGNLIDNALEAVTECNTKEVTFFVTDIGRDIIFEVADSGVGIPNKMEAVLFQKGYSNKGDNRGYGLANVQEEVQHLQGSIEVTNRKGEGVIFTIILPKYIHEERDASV